ncbi:MULTISPECIES: aldehyde dehydrogenase family protein [unclassified Pseudomonas]|uniref:aldehyde dehydrogenase family protein n=1 Tax=unclassified Pseudomonas TaxID=196821 RepID=UPI00128DEB11|nr:MULTISPECIES: aldehyde dehydrogenase family protein [unclassified Pseudomonas]MPQ70482.1 aldehyde dehydrogenase family protein [Pseudomonas sp. MWU12-2323]
MTQSMIAGRDTPPVPYTFDGLLINGKWCTGNAGSVLEVNNPYSHERLAEIHEANLGDVDRAYQAARAAQVQWQQSLPGERAAVLRKAVEVLDARHGEVVDWLIRESGSTRMKAEMEWGAARAIILDASTLPSQAQGRIIAGDIPGKENRIYRNPVGVVAVISPWNWPLHLTCRTLAPALALGNAVVVKPASETPITGGLLIARILEEAGLPAGVLNVLVGDPAVIGDGFVQHPVPRVVSFTGSLAVGRRIAGQIANSPRLKKMMLELGGNAPLVVLEDADLELAVHAAVVSKFLHQGQICVIANRILVHEKLHDAFVEQYVERVRELKVGNPNDPDTVIGPLISQKQLHHVQRSIAAANAEGARQRLGGAAQGLVVPPHVFDRITPQMGLGRSELFGPVAPVLAFASDAQALHMANDTEFGLSSAVFSRDVSRAERFAAGLQTGMTHINDITAVDLPNMPFGGEKNSGLGRFGSEGLIHELTTEHWMSVQHTSRQYPF